MNLRAILLCGALSAASLPAADTLTEQFQRALFEEEANRNLPAAIAGYEEVVKRLDDHRQLAATAVFRLGESYRKLGKTNDAVLAYERIIREFADQETLVKLSGQNLSILKPKENASPESIDPELARLIDLRIQMRIRLRQLRDQFTEEHPLVLQAKKEVQDLDAQIQRLTSEVGGQPMTADFAELRRLEILLETVRSLEPMSDAELRTLFEFANDDEAAKSLEGWRNLQRDLERHRSDLRNRPEDKTVEEQVQFHEKMVQDGEVWWSEWRTATLRMLEARVEAARRLARQGSTSVSEGSTRSNGSATDAVTRQEYLRLKTTLDQLMQTSSKEELKTLVLTLLRDASFAKLDEMEVAARAELVGLKSEFGPDHGGVKASQAKLDSITKTIDERIAGAIRAAEIKLAALEEAMTPQTTAIPAAAIQLDPAARARQKELLEQELALLASQLAAEKKQVEVGTLATEELIPRQREILRLQRQLAALDPTQDSINRQRAYFGTELGMVDQLIAVAKARQERGLGTEGEVQNLQRERLQLERELVALEQRSEQVASVASAPTMTAEEAEELRRVQALVANSPDLINVVDPADGQAPLHRAIQKGHLQVVSFLIRNGVDLNRPNQAGWLPVHQAARSGQLAALRMLVDSGVSLSVRDRSGNTPLHLAIGRGHDSVVSYLLEKGADLDAVDGQGQTSLHQATSSGATNRMAQLLDAGAGLEISAPAQNNRGIRNRGVEGSFSFNGTPLCFAVANERAAAAELLLVRGANVNPPDVESQPLLIAVNVGDTNMVRRLIEAGAKIEGQPLVDVALLTMPDQIPFLLETGADPNLVRYEQRQPPLLRAMQAYYHWWSTSGARENSAQSRGGSQVVLQSQPLRTVLQPTQGGGYSVGHLDVSNDPTVDWETLIKAMVGKGANPNAVHECQTVLTLLINPGPGARAPKEMIAWLLTQGADANLGGGRNSSGGWVDSPLKEACQLGDAELVSLLIKHRADTERREEAGFPTALFTAAIGEQPEVVGVLLANGANPNATGDRERNPLMELLHRFSGPERANLQMNGPFGSGMLEQFPSSLAAVPDRERKIVEIMQALLAKGARFDGELAEGFSPIHYAATKGDARILKLLLEFKANPNATNAVGITPLHTAAATNRPESIRLLVQAGADVNRQDQNGDTPLHIAAYRKRVPASEALLELGADRERTNRLGFKPAHIVSMNLPWANQGRPPFGLPAYPDNPTKSLLDVLGQ